MAKSKAPNLDYDKDKEYQSSAINMSDSIEQKSVYIYIEKFLGDEQDAQKEAENKAAHTKGAERVGNTNNFSLVKKKTFSKNAINSMRYGMKHHHHHSGGHHCHDAHEDEAHTILRFENNAEMDLT